MHGDELGATFDPANPLTSIDEPVGGVPPSDHYAVLADLEPLAAPMPDTSAV